MRKSQLITLTGLTTTLYSLGAICFNFTAHANESLLSPRMDKNLITQSTNCRTVDVDTVLNVRQTPRGKVIDTLANGKQVSITGTPRNRWVQIQAPVNGYIFAKYLDYCSSTNPTVPSSQTNSTVSDSKTNLTVSGSETSSTVPGSNCRQVNRDNLPVRTKPMGTIVGQLSRNQKVMLANEGYDGWVPIEAPMSGYIPSQYLTNCDGEASSPVSSTTEKVSTVVGSNCRQVLSPSVPLRKEPKGEIIGQLAQNQKVYIANEGINGWVPIEKPVSGFVTSPNLGQCAP